MTTTTRLAPTTRLMAPSRTTNQLGKRCFHRCFRPRRQRVSPLPPRQALRHAARSSHSPSFSFCIQYSFHGNRERRHPAEVHPADGLLASSSPPADRGRHVLHLPAG